MIGSSGGPSLRSPPWLAFRFELPFELSTVGSSGRLSLRSLSGVLIRLMPSSYIQVGGGLSPIAPRWLSSQDVSLADLFLRLGPWLELEDITDEVRFGPWLEDIADEGYGAWFPVADEKIFQMMDINARRIRLMIAELR